MRDHCVPKRTTRIIEKHPYFDRQPTVRSHDLFHPGGAPYRQREVVLIRRLTSENQAAIIFFSSHRRTL